MPSEDWRLQRRGGDTAFGPALVAANNNPNVSYGKFLNCAQQAQSEFGAAIDAKNPGLKDIFKTPDFITGGIGGTLVTGYKLFSGAKLVAAGVAGAESFGVSLLATGIYNYAVWSNKVLAPFEQAKRKELNNKIDQCAAQFGDFRSPSGNIYQ